MKGPALVTGASGFIGRHLVAMLRAQGIDTIGWSSADADLSDADAVRSGIAHVRPATIFHLASSGVAPSLQVEAMIARDVAMTANLLAAARPGTMLIQAGSMAEYGFPGRLSEDQPCRPHTIYGRAKLAATLHAMEHGPARGVAVRVARIFGAYGPGERADRLIPMLLHNLAAGLPVPLSDPDVRRDFIHVADACRAMIALAGAGANDASRIVNVGTGHAITLRAACERIGALLGADPALLRFGAVKRRATDEDVLEADTNRLLALTAEIAPQHLSSSGDAKLATLLGL